MIFVYYTVIFICGVAFSISHAIIQGEEGEVIKQSAEVNNIGYQKIVYMYVDFRSILLVYIGYR